MSLKNNIVHICDECQLHINGDVYKVVQKYRTDNHYVFMCEQCMRRCIRANTHRNLGKLETTIKDRE